MATKYGMRLYRHGIELKGDGRRREKLPGRRSMIVKQPKRSTYRGKIAAWSKASARRLAFIAANVELLFSSHLTLTYRARKKSWETVTERNLRIIEQCREDRHRFLRCLRDEIGEFLWVREFQGRGVVHFHVLTEKPVGQDRVSEAWSRASGQLHDDDVRRVGVKVDEISNQRGVRNYMGRYIGKEKQKTLSKGIDGAGRWWGRSRGLNLALLDEIIWIDPSEGYRKPPQLRIVRTLRGRVQQRFKGRFKRRFRGGQLVDFEGKLVALLCDMSGRLKAHYGWAPDMSELLEKHGFVLDEGDADDGRRAEGSGRGLEAGKDGSAGIQGRGDGQGAVQADLLAGEERQADDQWRWRSCLGATRRRSSAGRAPAACLVSAAAGI